MIAASGVSKRFGTRTVVDSVELVAQPNKMLGLIGPNGSGKSTLLSCLHAALKADAGSVTLCGQTIDVMKLRDIARSVAVVPQLATAMNGLKVAEYVLLGRLPHRTDIQRFTSEDHERARDALEMVGALNLAPQPLHELSGGERQRVSVARCLAQSTPLLLLDEPTNHLDVRFQHEVLALVRSLALTTVVVLHDLNLAARYCDHVAVMHEGRIVAAGQVSDVLQEDLLSEVYGIAVRRLNDGARLHFLFGD
jgi:iron complex transport system ATP-binding protein